jgi:hypothetical protein
LQGLEKDHTSKEEELATAEEAKVRTCVHVDRGAGVVSK